MDLLRSFYPALSEREPIPVLYQPSIFGLSLVPFLFRNRRPFAFAIFPVVTALCIRAPRYTFGSPSGDYYSSSPFFAIPLWFLDFAILAPQTGKDAPRYIGPDDASKAQVESENRPASLWEKSKWAFSLMIPSHRGIGWNWQVKGVPGTGERDLNKWSFVRKQALKVAVSYFRSSLILVFLGIGSSLESSSANRNPISRLFINALVGWSGATWVWDRLCCAYSVCAVVTVAVGLCAPWQWPPLMGNIRDAWSVRQMWSVVYHQMMRRMLSQPALRVTRALGLRKGSIQSRYFQLYFSFWISALIHQYQMFFTTRSDMGEFLFFMSQPVAITLEDIAKWLWGRFNRTRSTKEDKNWTAHRNIGYLWVFVWFSISLPIYARACRDAGVMDDIIFGDQPFRFGASLVPSQLGI